MSTKVLIVGSRGMLGHQLALGLSKKPEYHVQTEPPKYDARMGLQTLAMLEAFEPDFIVNAIGLTNKRRASMGDFVKVNGIFPHQLARLGQTRLIQISTDCVFSGKQGNYKEQDPLDATDDYGISKQLGEVTYGNAVTLRTSFIGRELYTKRGLLEWLLTQNGKNIEGFKNHFFSGITTVEMVKVVDTIIQRWQPGLYHVAGPKISKHDLLMLLIARYDLRLVICATEKNYIDRSLDGTKFRHVYEYMAPTWEEMIDDLP